MKAPRPVALLLLVGLAACGATAREKTINATFASLQAADDAFATYNYQHQHEVVQQATDKASVEAAVTKWRAQATGIETDLAAAFRATSAASILSTGTLDGMLKAASVILVELRALGVVK